MSDPSDPKRGQSLWQGRFGDAPAEELLDFTESLSFDRRLAADDLAGSRAHVDMLARVGLITEEERAVVAAALARVEAEINAGTFTFLPLDEDIHTAVERRVTELAGPAGAKLHTGRSRNDQVALDLRLYVRREGRAMARRLCNLMQVLLRRAAEAHAADVYLPGYTHMQRAQPVMLAHHLLAHFWALSRDVDRLGDALERADVSPLGAGALAGSTLPLDPGSVAADLGFARPFENSLDAVSDRDFVAELLFVSALCQVHLSRLGEEVVLWATEEFGFLKLADAYSTGSSMLPQKKNPDIAELVRGKAGRLIGHLTGFLATLKGLPLSYNRDLQEDKEPLFDTLDTLALAATAMAGLLDTATFDYDRMRAAADTPSSAAADLAEDLVRGGMPFRDAHALIGKLVRESVERGIPLDELIMTEPKLGPDALAALEPGASVRRRTSPGGAGTASVAAQMEAARARLADQEGRLAKVAEPVSAAFYVRDPRDVAVDLLNKLLVHEDPVHGRIGGRIVEAEAYLGVGLDPGSHAFRGPGKKNATMFGPPGRLYVYFTYGMHWCSNVVCNPSGGGGAVLMRGLAPLEGLDVMWARRPKARRERDPRSGPARLCQALGLTGDVDGADLSTGPVLLLDDGTPPPSDPGNSVRIGLSPGKGDDSPWRWFVSGDPNVSRR